MRRAAALVLLAFLAFGTPAGAQDEEATAEGDETEPAVADGILDADAPRSQPSGVLPVPRPVYVGMYLFHVPSMDLDTNSYLVDFYLWFRLQGDDLDPSTTFEFMNAVEGWDQQRAAVYVDDEGNELPDDLGDGWRYQVFHIQGRFGHAFDIRAYYQDGFELEANHISLGLLSQEDRLRAAASAGVGLRYAVGRGEALSALYPFFSRGAAKVEYGLPPFARVFRPTVWADAVVVNRYRPDLG